ncbi:MAG: hypothetical protein ABSD73_11835 [Candidatus Bathyarchaeia archaeon]|jgi:hypothetical protein
MTADKDKAEANIRAFIDKYGETGFLELYFTNYLFELLMSYLRSHSKMRELDGGYQYHFKGKDMVIAPNEEQRFREDLKLACSKKAKAIVAQLQERGLLSRFGLDLSSITREATDTLSHSVREIFETVFQTEWEEE